MMLLKWSQRSSEYLPEVGQKDGEKGHLQKEIPLESLMRKIEFGADVQNYHEVLLVKENSKDSVDQYDKYSAGGAFEYMNSMNLLDMIEAQDFMNYIARKIDMSLDFPEYFIETNVNDRVVLYVTLDGQGKLKSLDKIEGYNDLLNAYVTVVALISLSEVNVPDYWIDKDSIPLILSFRFGTQAYLLADETDNFRIFKNSINFDKKREVLPDTLKKLGRLKTDYLPFIGLVGGTVMFDIVGTVDKIRLMTEGKTAESEYQERLETLRKKLDAHIRAIKQRHQDKLLPDQSAV
jgi:hypothetical protein